MSTSYIRLGDSIRYCFGTQTPSTGAAIDADSTPTVTVLEQGSALVYSPTVTKITTGLYEVVIACTTGNGFEVGKEYSAYAAATVSSVTGRKGIASFVISTRMVDDLTFPATAGRSTTVSASGEVVASSISAGGITAASFAADAITAAKIAADVGTEIAAAVLAAASSTPIAADVQKWIGVVPAALTSVNKYLQVAARWVK